MIDYMQPSSANMNPISRLTSKELTRRSSCNSPLTFRKNSFLRLQNRLSCSNQNLSANIEFSSNTLGDLTNKRVGLPNRRLSASLLSTASATQKRLAPATKPPQLLPKTVQSYIEEKALLTNCQDVYICDGSEKEKEALLKMMADKGMITPLKKYENCWLARTDARDVARVESKTFICTRNKHDVIPRGQQVVAGDGKQVALGNWMHIDELDDLAGGLLKNCMKGRTMYVIPFSMGPIGGKLSKVGIQLTDSPYVVVSMHVMTRVSLRVLQIISQQQGDFVRCFHSVGCPLPLERPLVNNWPCNPEKTIISHIPERKEIISFGSGYGGNSLLGKKCFALRLGSLLGRQEGWLAEHMLILGITNPQGVKKYIAAAFPSACGKTNLAMMAPTLPGYKIECVGDDIAWMRFDENGVLRAINPEAGFFGVAPGTNEQSNPNAMRTIEKNTIFTNVAETSDGGFYWEGLEQELSDGVQVKDWQGRDWNPQTPGSGAAAHPNSRFCAPSSQCPMIDSQWESAEGVPISAIIFGGRRPEGVPLVYESFDWNHGIYVGASMRSESTAAAEHKAKIIMHDPFAMRPFFGYNFGQYLDHWLSFGRDQLKSENGAMQTDISRKLPKIFHVNWFRKSQNGSGQFLWPGFGENSRVLDWICRRVDGENCAKETPIGLVPTSDSLNLDGLESDVDLKELFSISTEFWLEEQATVDRYLRANVGSDLPSEIIEQSDNLRRRILNQ